MSGAARNSDLLTSPERRRISSRQRDASGHHTECAPKHGVPVEETQCLSAFSSISPSRGKAARPAPKGRADDPSPDPAWLCSAAVQLVSVRHALFIFYRTRGVGSAGAMAAACTSLVVLCERSVCRTRMTDAFALVV